MMTCYRSAEETSLVVSYLNSPAAAQHEKTTNDCTNISTISCLVAKNINLCCPKDGCQLSPSCVRSSRQKHGCKLSQCLCKDIQFSCTNMVEFAPKKSLFSRMRGKMKNNKVDAYFKTDAFLKCVTFTSLLTRTLLQKTTLTGTK